MEPHRGERSHLPAPTLYPIGFAAGIAVVLVGLIVNPKIIAPIGGAIALVFAFLWVRDATSEYRGVPQTVEPETRVAAPAAPARPATEGGDAMPPPAPGERFPRSRFLEGATLGIGALIGGIVTVPAAGLAVDPAFTSQKKRRVDLGPLSKFVVGKWFVVSL